MVAFSISSLFIIWRKVTKKLAIAPNNNAISWRNLHFFVRLRQLIAVFVYWKEEERGIKSRWRNFFPDFFWRVQKKSLYLHRHNGVYCRGVTLWVITEKHVLRLVHWNLGNFSKRTRWITYSHAIAWDSCTLYLCVMVFLGPQWRDVERCDGSTLFLCAYIYNNV